MGSMLTKGSEQTLSTKLNENLNLYVSVIVKTIKRPIKEKKPAVLSAKDHNSFLVSKSNSGLHLLERGSNLYKGRPTSKELKNCKPHSTKIKQPKPRKIKNQKTTSTFLPKYTFFLFRSQIVV